MKRILVVVAAVAALVAPALSPAGAARLARSSHAEPTYQLLTEPGEVSPIYSFISSARKSLDMTMYELSDPTAERRLAQDASRGVKVRVVLDRNLEQENNEAAYSYLSAHGVKVRWAPHSYDATHQKTITVDDDASMIMTLNLTSRYYATTRDFAVVDRDKADVQAIESVFGHDFAGDSSSPEPTGADLIWSPGSDAALVALINSSRHSLYVENEEMSEYTIVDALEDAARRGVDVHVVMTNDSSWRSNFDALERAGVHVRTFPDSANALYIHAKVIDVDPGASDRRAFIGSENFSWASLQYNRELGLVLAGGHGALIAKLTKTLERDYAAARPWSA